MKILNRNFSDLTIIAIIATKLKTLLMLNAVYSRSLFLVFIKEKSLYLLNAIIQNTAVLEKKALKLYSFRTLKFLCLQYNLILKLYFDLLTKPELEKPRFDRFILLLKPMHRLIKKMVIFTFLLPLSISVSVCSMMYMS